MGGLLDDPDYWNQLGGLLSGPGGPLEVKGLGAQSVGGLGAVHSVVPRGGIAPVAMGGKKAKQLTDIHSFDDLEKLLSGRDKLFVRWSRGPKHDMKPGAVSKDYQTGQSHEGLSAMAIDKEMGRERLFRFLRDYGYLRDPKYPAKPHIYAGKVVGHDSDNADSILPSEYIGTISDDFVSFIDDDTNLARVALMDQIEQNKRALDHYKDNPQTGNYKPVWTEQTLAEFEKKLAAPGGPVDLPSAAKRRAPPPRMGRRR